jgi:hypothetical protein
MRAGQAYELMEVALPEPLSGDVVACPEVIDPTSHGSFGFEAHQSPSRRKPLASAMGRSRALHVE